QGRDVPAHVLDATCARGSPQGRPAPSGEACRDGERLADLDAHVREPHARRQAGDEVDLVPLSLGQLAARGPEQGCVDGVAGRQGARRTSSEGRVRPGVWGSGATRRRGGSTTASGGGATRTWPLRGAASSGSTASSPSAPAVSSTQRNRRPSASATTSTGTSS